MQLFLKFWASCGIKNLGKLRCAQLLQEVSIKNNLKKDSRALKNLKSGT